MVAINPVTGDKIQSKTNSSAYADGYDRIFGKGKRDEKPATQPNPGHDPVPEEVSSVVGSCQTD